jgi:hypothetical protein
MIIKLWSLLLRRCLNDPIKGCLSKSRSIKSMLSCHSVALRISICYELILHYLPGWTTKLLLGKFESLLGLHDLILKLSLVQYLVDVLYFVLTQHVLLILLDQGISIIY